MWRQGRRSSDKVDECAELLDHREARWRKKVGDVDKCVWLSMQVTVQRIAVLLTCLTVII